MRKVFEMSSSWFTMFFRDFVNPAEIFSDYAFAITSDMYN